MGSRPDWLRDLRAELLVAAGGAGRILGSDPVYRRVCGDHSGCGVALFQFGLGTEFWSCFAVYLIIQGLDGNLLVPVLFSEAVNLHPLVIILSVVIFGGLWGFWGVFFAIPLATLIKAVVHAWPDVPAVEESFCRVALRLPGLLILVGRVRRSRHPTLTFRHFLSATSTPRRGGCWF